MGKYYAKDVSLEAAPKLESGKKHSEITEELGIIMLTQQGVSCLPSRISSTDSSSPGVCPTNPLGFSLYTCGRLRRRILYMGIAFTAPSTTHVEGLSTR